MFYIIGEIDYVTTPFRAQFTPNQRRHCFGIVLINDLAYEVREEFYVNLTTEDLGVILSPSFTIVVVDDDDSKNFTYKVLNVKCYIAVFKWHMHLKCIFRGRLRGEGSTGIIRAPLFSEKAHIVLASLFLTD